MSLAGSIASMTARSRIVGGSGIWTMTPSTVGSSLSSRMRRDDARLGRLALELDEPGVDADLGAAAQDLLEVDRRRRVAADDDDGEAGRAAVGGREGGDVLGDRGPDLVGDRPALEQSRAGDQPSIRRAPGAAAARAARRRPTISRVSAARRSTSWSSCVDADGHRVLELGVADRRQVDQDVGGGAAGGGLAEQRRDVEVARRR